MINELFNGMMGVLMVKFCLNDIPHAAKLLVEKPKFYVKSKLPSQPFLYHHAIYTGLKRIAERWAIEVPSDKQVISLTTDPGRYLSPLPILATIASTVDGVVKIPLTDELRDIAIPALYITRDQELIEKARGFGHEVYAEDQLPPEYKYILKFVTHHAMFISENEYTVISKVLVLPEGSIIYIHPAKLKRFKAGLRPYSMTDIRSLEELAK